MSSTEDHDRIASADPWAIREALYRISENYWPRQIWRHPDGPDDMEAVIRRSPPPTDYHVHDYVALSALHHCYDGWSYLSRAIGAETVANPEVARHLGYYAQLRAAMSILAMNGIGIMRMKYVTIDNKGAYTVGSCGNTHIFTWKALKAWTDENNYAMFLNTIRPGGLPLRKWTESIDVRGNALGESWVRDWSQEFHNMPGDRYSRNQASYDPVALSPTFVDARPARDVLDAVVSMWRLLEPEGTSGFAKLDSYLLRRAVTRISAVHEDVSTNHCIDEVVIKSSKTYLSTRLGNNVGGMCSW